MMTMADGKRTRQKKRTHTLFDFINLFLMEYYIGLCKQIARSVMMQSDLYLYTLAFCPYLLQEHLSKKKEPRF